MASNPEETFRVHRNYIRALRMLCHAPYSNPPQYFCKRDAMLKLVAPAAAEVTIGPHPGEHHNCISMIPLTSVSPPSLARGTRGTYAISGRSRVA
jgi:hypothetical protein